MFVTYLSVSLALENDKLKKRNKQIIFSQE